MRATISRSSQRSIPAGAGEPVLGRRLGDGAQVYPRGCGGTSIPSCSATRTRGLSPRVRGNLPQRDVRAVVIRSIPAGAGEPQICFDVSPFSAVYPRGCGGTSVSTKTIFIYLGLSPRVRGNPASTRSRGVDARSIPAGAGEPIVGLMSILQIWVYPRGCGGTM